MPAITGPKSPNIVLLNEPQPQEHARVPVLIGLRQLAMKTFTGQPGCSRRDECRNMSILGGESRVMHVQHRIICIKNILGPLLTDPLPFC